MRASVATQGGEREKREKDGPDFDSNVALS